MVPFEFTKYLQDVFNAPIVIQLTDDENSSLKKARLSKSQNTQERMPRTSSPLVSISKRLSSSAACASKGKAIPRISISTDNQVRGAFGFKGSDSIGKHQFPAIEMAPAFATTFPHIFGTGKEVAKIPCLIPCAIDQDPFFRLCRDVAPKLKFKKPAVIRSNFFPVLKGPGGKMSASNDSSAIFLSDTPKQIKKKINASVYRGGETIDLHKFHGGDTEKDVAYQYLRYLHESDEELERIRVAYKKGEMGTAELKEICISLIQEKLVGFQERRKAITKEVLEGFIRIRPLKFGGKRE